jgi:SlyX protein
MADTTDERVTELEIRLSFQNDRIEQLDQVVRDQFARMEDLERRLSELRQQIDEAPGEANSLADEKPPHY